MSQKQTRIVVAGAGYAGVMCAIRLAGRIERLAANVTLISASDQFVERPRLHEVATGNEPRHNSLARMLHGSGVCFRQAYISALHPERRSLTINSDNGKQEIVYEYLVYALGSHVDRESVDGVQEYAYTLDAMGQHSARALYRRLTTLSHTRQDASVLVVGSGATGVELAAEIADCFPGLQVTIVTRGDFGTFKNRAVQTYMRRAMARLGVEILEHASVSAVEEKRLIIADGRTVAYDVCVWAGGFRAPSLARQAGIQVNWRDQITTDACLRSISHPHIYAVGDAGRPEEQPGAPVRMALFTALVTGAHAADNLGRHLRGEAQRPLGFSYFGQGIALGRRDAVAFASYPDDDPVGPIYTGRVALALRNFFVWLILQLLKVERWHPGLFFWLGRDRGARHAGAMPTTLSSHRDESAKA